MKNRDILLITIISLILFIPFLGKVHLFDWDEINFAEVAREMIVTKNYSQVLINYQPFTEKPPFFFLIQVLSMKLWGINEFAARFPNAIIGAITLVSVYLIGLRLRSRSLGWFWVLAYAGSFLPHLYFKSAIIDPMFNLFIFLGVYFSFEILINSKRNLYNKKNVVRNSILSGVFIGLAILTKGPVGLIISVLTIIIFWIIGLNLFRIKLRDILVFTLSLLVVISVWFALETIKHGFTFITEFYIRHVELFRTGDAGHGGPFYYHIVILMVGVFPASILAIDVFFNKYSNDENEILFRRIMIILFITVLIIFSIVKTKIVHYSSLAYFPLTFLAAIFLDNLYKKDGQGIKKYNLIILSVFGVIISLAITAVPITFFFRESFAPNIKDIFFQACILADVNWTIWDGLIGFIYLIVIIISIILINHSMYRLKGIILLFFSTILCIQLNLLVIVPKIEKHTQNAAIEFYESLKDKDCYVEVLGFKSYAHLFYSKKQPLANPKAYEINWLLSDKVDKPAYFVVKIHKANRYKKEYNLKEVYQKNGFVFLVNNPIKRN